MIRLTELKLPLSAVPVDERRASDAPAETAQDRLPVPHPLAALTTLAAQALGVAETEINQLHVFKRSFDARKSDILAVYIVDVAVTCEAATLEKLAGKPHIGLTPDQSYPLPFKAPAFLPLRPVVVGFGPCGIFAALLLAQMGFKPIVLERGRSVRHRTQDTWGLWRKHILNPESNVQFGEGGAGTFSDGKLWSQIKDPRHLGRKVMLEFVQAGAPPDILVEAHPHIGTFKLVKVVENLRAKIITLGGEIRFEQRVIDVILNQDQSTPPAKGLSSHMSIAGLKIQNQTDGSTYEIAAHHVVMALGHSARDTFEVLFERGVEMHAKAFSVGFRVEHPQSVIDRARWGRHAGHPMLGAADYKLVHHAGNGRAVYSFCMCPGGTVVAATSEPGRVVTNGMSQYSRNERNANAGIVVGIEPKDFGVDMPGEELMRQPNGEISPMAGIALQRRLETNAYLLGGSTYEAPAQLVGDFLANQPSLQLGSVLPSYQPGVKLGSLNNALPAFAIEAIREAFPVFGRKIKGFDMADAVLTGVETRTSSPLRIPRGDDFQSLNVRGLYPAGEGAGYAGGILSAGVDGIKVAEAVARHLLLTS